MTDGQWALLAPLLPAAGSTGGRGGRPEKWDRRLVLDAIFYLVRGGIAWRVLPADFPPHQTVYALFRWWTRARTWCRIYAALRERARLADGRGPVPTAAVIDSQTVRAADTVPTASSGYDGGKKIKGRKRHVAVDTGGLLLAVVVTTASLQDRDGAFRITAALRGAFSTITLVWADAGYTGRFVRDAPKIWDLAVAIVNACRPSRSLPVLWAGRSADRRSGDVSPPWFSLVRGVLPRPVGSCRVSAMATTFADLEARVRGLESRAQRTEEDMTALITTVIETRDDVRWLKRAVQALLVDGNITIEPDDEPGE
jgi:transposase